MTTRMPRMKPRGMFRRGFLISPPLKLRRYQPSYAQKIAMKAFLKPARMSASGEAPRMSQKGERFDQLVFAGWKMPEMTSAIAASFVTVRMFWMAAPHRTPIALAAVRRTMRMTETVLIQWLSAAGRLPSGRRLKKYSAEMTARAAMLAELMMRRFVQPKRNAVSFPKDSRRYVYWPPAPG